MDWADVNWSRWTRTQAVREGQGQGILHMDILALRSSFIHMSEKEVVGEQVPRSQVGKLWMIGYNVLREYKFGYECIEMMTTLAYFNSTPVDARVIESEENRTSILMLRDLGFLTLKRNQTGGNFFISTTSSAILDEIREKNLPNQAEFLREIIILLKSCKSRLQGREWHWYQHITPICVHLFTLPHEIRNTLEFEELWGDYLRDLFEYERHGLNDGQKQVLSSAIDTFDAEYGNIDPKSIELRFTQLRFDLRGEEDVEILLMHSRDYGRHLETYLMTTHEPWEHGPASIGQYVPDDVNDVMRPRSVQKQQQMAELIYKKALQMDAVDVNFKTLLLEEALAYCMLSNNLWKSTIPDSNGDTCFGLNLKCLAQLGRWDEGLDFVLEIKEILMRRALDFGIPWFSDAILHLTQEFDGQEMILKELSLFLNYFYNNRRFGIFDEEYFIKSLIKCESGLEKWDRILVIMRGKRENWMADRVAFSPDLKRWVGYELTLLDSIKDSNSTNELVDDLVNESLEFAKQLVEFRLNNGAYGEKYRVERLCNYSFKDDPLVLVIKICLAMCRHEEILSYLLEYEKLLEEKYGDRLGPVTNGILVFGEWVGDELRNQVNTGSMFKKFLRGVKATTQNRIDLLSDHPIENKKRMQVYADLISGYCDSYLSQR